MQKKGQAAMEFLMTYGWAILAAIIVIGILGYYYFSKTTLTPSAAVVNPPFYLNAWTAKTTGVTLELKNNGGETYTISEVGVTNCATTTSAPGDIAAGATKTVALTCTLTSGSTFKGDIAVKYTKAGSALELTSTGSITEKVS